MKDSYTILTDFVNDLRRIGIQKTNFEVNVKFLKNLTEAWQQAAVHLQMTHNLRSQGFHDLYRMMVQHEEVITRKAKKTDEVVLFSKHEEGAHSKGKIQKRDEASFVAYSSESDEDIKEMN